MCIVLEGFMVGDLTATLESCDGSCGGETDSKEVYVNRCEEAGGLAVAVHIT